MAEQAANYITLNVNGSKPIFRPDGTTALLLRTLEKGAIAFQLDLNAIGIIQRDLTVMEQFLRQPTGKA